MPSVQLRVLVFVSGLSVMAVEMTALRLLAPYFGTSLWITTILIGSMMGFLSLGYWLGGRYGDRSAELRGLCRTTALAALFVLLLPFAARPILQGSSAVLWGAIHSDTALSVSGGVRAVALGLLATLSLIAIPVTLMGMVSPWAVRLAVRRVESTGQVVGRLYALSTLGSILGSFLPALVLVPLLGVRHTFLAVGGVFLVVSAVGLCGGVRGVATALIPIGLALLPQGLVRPIDGLVTETESLYHFIQVVQKSYGGCAAANHLYLNEGIAVHSVSCLDADQPIRGNWAYAAAAPLYRQDPQSTRQVLNIGLAGGTMARHILAAFPDAHVDGVEIDGEVVAVGKRYFDDAHPRITTYVMDGRVFLQNTDKRYDVILVDAYRQPYIPFHLATVEFWREVHEHLSDDGVMAMNVASVRGVSQELVRMIYRTLREVFPSVHYVKALRSNDMLYATCRPTDPLLMWRNLESMGYPGNFALIRRGLKRKIRGELEGWESARLLTDDQAPVELIWEKMALEYAR